MGEKRIFILVHGGFRGGWCYAPVAKILREAGHLVHAPSLTGLGDRSHLAGEAVNASTHIADIVNLIRWERLEDVVLVGHSYGGFVITGVADRIPEKLRALVYLDSSIPSDGGAMLDVTTEAERAIIEGAADHGWLMQPAPASAFGLEGEIAALVDDLSTAQPLNTLSEKIRVSGAYLTVPRKAYVRATGWPRSQPFYDRLKEDPAWQTFLFDCAHDLMLERPEETAELLMQVAG